MWISSQRQMPNYLWKTNTVVKHVYEYNTQIQQKQQLIRLLIEHLIKIQLKHGSESKH